MARIPRQYLVYEGSLFHVTWQCHNRDFLLKPKWAKKLLYDLLLKHKDKYGMTFFSYIIMDNHLHLSGKAPDVEKFSRFFQVVHSKFAKMVNYRRRRCGQVIRDRFKSPLLQSEESLIQEMIYHDLNEVRCGKADDPKDNEMSSYAFYAQGKDDPLITAPPFYENLGKKPRERQKAYRSLVLEILVQAPRKKDGQYTQQLFIGDPLWVEQKIEELKALRAKAKFENILPASQSPPAQL